jgi:hypothetical protein
MALAGQRIANINMYRPTEKRRIANAITPFPTGISIRRENTVARFWYFRGGVTHLVWYVTDRWTGVTIRKHATRVSQAVTGKSASRRHPGERW